MRRIISTILLISLSLSALSQTGSTEPGKVTGRVLDSASTQPIEYATITLFPAGHTKPTAGISTDKKGVFTIESLASGNYRLVIDFIGYRSRNVFIKITPRQAFVSLGAITLSNQAQTLTGVTITGQKKLIENKIDKIVYNAERDLTSQTGVATDLLQKVPQVSVDVDGNVELQGSGNILFLINGKPSTIFGSNITDVLQAIPASEIKSIEVITNPGARYDAKGSGGIINIILKHNSAQGINGNLSLTAGTLLQNGSFNLDAKKGNFALNAFVNGNARLSRTTPTSSLRTSTDTGTKTTALLQQDGANAFTRHGYQSGVGFDWTITDRDNLSGGSNYQNFGNRAHGYLDQLEQTQTIAGGAFQDLSTINHTSHAFTEYSFDPNLSFKHTFKDKDQELEIILDGSFAHNSSTAGNDQYLQPKDSLSYATRNDNPAKENQYEAMINYTQPLRENVNLGLGGKFSAYDISSAANASLWNPFANGYLYDSALSNNLNYHQRVYAAYAELNFPIAKTINARLGSRYERTRINSFFANAHESIHNGYNTIIPSIFLMQKLGETQTIKLSFTIRINRPDYSDLNPFINTSDPKNIVTGNPSLKPEIWDRYEASYSKEFGKTGSITATLYYRQSNGDIQPFIVYYPSLVVGDTTYTNVSVTTRQNIGIEKNAGTNLFVDLHPTDKWSIRSNMIVFYRYTINQVDPGYNSHTTIYRFNINSAYQFTNNFAAEFFGNFNSHHHEAQGYYPSFISYNIALRKQFWNKKGSLALTANNILANYVSQRTELFGPGFVSSNVRRIPFRSIGLNFSWKFGYLVIKKEKQEDNGPDLSLPSQ